MLPGDHVRPLRQAFGDLPPELAQVANQAVTQGSYFLQGLSNMATQAGFAEVRYQDAMGQPRASSYGMPVDILLFANSA